MGSSLLARAHGQWTMIYRELGIDAKLMNHKPHKCPHCDERTPGGLRYSDRGNSYGTWFHGGSKMHPVDFLRHARGGSVAEVYADIEGVIGKEDSPEAEDRRRKYTQARRRLRELERTAKIGGPEVSAYLASRGLEPTDRLLENRVRELNGDRYFPAMLGKIVDAHGKPLSFHATLIQGGRKAETSPVKRVLSAGTDTRSGAVRLMKSGPTLGVAEGIETALAASRLHGVPVWATINTAGMASFEPPATVEHLLIFGDNDENYAGLKAAAALAHRVSTQNRMLDVDIVMPPKTGEDWADIWLRKVSSSVSRVVSLPGRVSHAGR